MEEMSLKAKCLKLLCLGTKVLAKLGNIARSCM